MTTTTKRHPRGRKQSLRDLVSLFLTTYLYVAAIVLLVAIEADEQLRRDLQGDEERGILQLVRAVL